jgi:ribose transport system permease protein
LTIGMGVLLISGGLDLSVGALAGLTAVGLAVMLDRQVAPVMAVSGVVLGCVLVGLFHGFLVCRLHLPPYLATWCGLFLYRGLALGITMMDFAALGNRLRGEGSWTAILASTVSREVDLRQSPNVEELGRFLVGSLGGVPIPLFILALVVVLALVFLHASVAGRYLYALGNNEPALRYAGVSTGRYRTLAYVICSLLAGLGGILLFLDRRQVNPGTAGQFYELYALTGAVLGGCSLKGGRGSIPGILLGTAALTLLIALARALGLPGELEFGAIGLAFLLGVSADFFSAKRLDRIT